MEQSYWQFRREQPQLSNANTQVSNFLFIIFLNFVLPTFKEIFDLNF